MKISLIVEGKTEKVFVCKLREYLETPLHEKMPKLPPVPQNHGIPLGDKLDKLVNSLLSGRDASDHVIALTDVYPMFSSAGNAKEKIRQSVKNQDRFHVHVAQYEFEAWLLPYWPQIQQLAKHNQSAPRGSPEMVNHNNPPSTRIKEIFRRGNGRDGYIKTRDAPRILKNADLNIAIQQCSELKSLVNTILSICGGQTIP